MKLFRDLNFCIKKTFGNIKIGSICSIYAKLWNLLPLCSQTSGTYRIFFTSSVFSCFLFQCSGQWNFFGTKNP